MLTYSYLVQSPARFKSLTGVTLAEFDALLERLLPVWVAAEQVRLARPQRQRAEGGGRQPSLCLASQLLLVLIWLRLYLSTAALGSLFGIDKATVSRITSRLLPLLQQVSALDLPLPPQRGKDLAQAQQDDGELAALLAELAAQTVHVIDVTEQAVERPCDKLREQQYYSGKQRCHTCKHALDVSACGLIRTVTAVSPGGVHDLTHVRRSGLLALIPADETVVADAGFAGLHTDLPQHSVAIPHKAARGHPLLPDHKRINAELSAQRVIVENVICQLKHFAVLTQRFRHSVERWHDAVFCIIASIVNRRTLARLAG